MYLNWVNFPFGVDWTKGGERFGFRQGSVRTVYVETPDNMTLGGWHILPRRMDPFPSPYKVDEAKLTGDLELRRADRVYLYLHGNAGNRATGHRVQFYQMLTRLPGAHVLAIDYRGFGDSSSVIPTETGLCTDALAAYHWLRERKVPGKRIVITGHSLGSGIATHLAAHLSQAGEPYGGLLILSGYASLIDAAMGYGTVPLLKPFQGISFIEEAFRKLITQRFMSVHNIRKVNRPVLLVHGKRDHDINHWNAKALFMELLGARSNLSLVQHPYLDLKSHTLDIQQHPVKTYEMNAGDLWEAKMLYLLQVEYAGHNNLAKHLIVEDTIAYWSQTWA
ncbi:Alpha/Beta hydrolase protein [Gorgonomyces haynaldii]|nr:Alpha/Beta hydrolase protein [Gorgonomyces haynaldii]